MKKSIHDVSFQGQRVLLRVDFNVPMKDGQVVSDQRIVAALPTIKHILSDGPTSLILISHLGRPDGQRVSEFSLIPIVALLENLLGEKVTWVDDCVGSNALEQITSSTNRIFLLENLRFHPEEEGSYKQDGQKVKCSKKDVEKFSKSLTSLADVYVNDAFGTAHRAHASMVGIDLPNRVMGELMKTELEYFDALLNNAPKGKFLAIVGGAKVSDKILLLESMIDRVDRLIICGGMAYTFKKVVDSVAIGKSLFDENGAKQVQALVDKAKVKGVELVLPIDHVTAKGFQDVKANTVTDQEGISADEMALDCGPKTNDLFKQIVLTSDPILWNGPPGVFEFTNFSHGSRSLLDACVQAHKAGAQVIIGGGDTASLVLKYNQQSNVSHVSTGGGATLELLEGKVLPGVAALSEK